MLRYFNRQESIRAAADATAVRDAVRGGIGHCAKREWSKYGDVDECGVEVEEEVVGDVSRTLARRERRNSIENPRNVSIFVTVFSGESLQSMILESNSNVCAVSCKRRS